MTAEVGKTPIQDLRQKDGTALLRESEVADFIEAGWTVLSQLADNLLRHRDHVIDKGNLLEDRVAEIEHELRTVYPAFMAEREKPVRLRQQQELRIDHLTVNGKPLLTSHERHVLRLRHTTLGHLTELVVASSHALRNLGQARMAELKVTLTSEFPELVEYCQTQTARRA